MKITIPSALQLALAIALTAQFASEAEASKKYVKLLPNGANVPDTPAIGHPDGTGDDSDTNAFGDAFADADYTWTKELCEADTDGDGQTNGQELGDPCCEWTVGATPLWTTGVSHPGDATKTSDASLWASACGSTTTEETTDSAATTTDSTSEPTSGTETETTTSIGESTSAPTASSTESADESDGVSAHSSADASNSTTTASTTTEKCVSDLASTTRALRTSN